jgi:hypothetical protein
MIIEIVLVLFNDSILENLEENFSLSFLIGNEFVTVFFCVSFGSLRNFSLFFTPDQAAKFDFLR